MDIDRLLTERQSILGRLMVQRENVDRELKGLNEQILMVSGEIKALGEVKNRLERENGNLEKDAQE
jgi:hypothetical protein